MLARCPARQPDRRPFVDVLWLTAVDGVADTICSSVAFELSVHEPEVDHYRICFRGLVLTLGPAIRQQRLCSIHRTRGRILHVLSFGRDGSIRIRHLLPGVCRRGFVSFSAAIPDGKLHHLKSPLILIAFMPGPRWENAESVLAVGNIPQLERWT